VYEALRAGACGFLLKHAPPEELLLGVRAAADGGALLSPAVTRRLIAEFAQRRPPGPPPAALGRLTAREREVLGLVVRGRTNAEIAAEPVVSLSTVKTHLGHVLDKLGLRDRVHAVVYGYEHGLVAPGNDRS
jgi:DNA-binding NarL/FixJ family response regulator